jgi:hypothetical protein
LTDVFAIFDTLIDSRFIREVLVPTDLLTVTDTATQFLVKAGYIFHRLRSANFDNSKNKWILEFDVGITSPDLKKLGIDESGQVLSFE